MDQDAYKYADKGPPIPNLTELTIPSINNRNRKRRLGPDFNLIESAPKRRKLHGHTFTIPMVMSNSTSYSFLMGMEEVAFFLKDSHMNSGDWDWEEFGFRLKPCQTYLYTARQQVWNTRERTAYVSEAELKYFRRFLRVDEEDAQGNMQSTAITPSMVKHVWKKHHQPLWSDSWKSLFTQHSRGDPDRALINWKKACGNLHSVYCKEPKLGDFLQSLLLNKLKVVAENWDKFEHFKNVNRGCGICRFQNPPRDAHAFRTLYTHIFCECPVVLQALAELHLTPIQDLSELGFASKRIKEPDKPKIAYATWHFERELRRHDNDGHNELLFEKFKRYIRYTLTPGNPLTTFQWFRDTL